MEEVEVVEVGGGWVERRYMRKRYNEGGRINHGNPAQSRKTCPIFRNFRTRENLKQKTSKYCLRFRSMKRFLFPRAGFP